MPITIEDDVENVGHAIIRLDRDYPEDLSVSVQFLDKTYLGSDGRRTRERHLFETEPLLDDDDCSFVLGPDITTYVREAEIVTLADAHDTMLGQLVWEGVRPPPERGGGMPIGSRPRRTRSSARVSPRSIDRPKTNPGSIEQDTISTAGTENLDSSGGKPEERIGFIQPLPPVRSRVGLSVLTICVLILLASIPAFLVLSGRIGWEMHPQFVAFTGPANGPFAPVVQTVRFERAWYVQPFAPFLFGNAGPLAPAAVPVWLHLAQQRSGPAWLLAVTPDLGATRSLAIGHHPASLPLRFPLSAPPEAQLSVDVVVEEPGRLVFDPETLEFKGPPGGPFQPSRHEVALRNVRGAALDWRISDLPAWLRVSPVFGHLRRSDAVAIELRLNDTATHLQSTMAGRLVVSTASNPVIVRVVIDRPPPPVPSRPVKPPLPPPLPLPVAHPQVPPPPVNPIDDVACDRIAGNRFDLDHPRDRGFNDDVARLTSDDLEMGLKVCDPSLDRAGHDRRFAVQRARLLAERAIRRALNGDSAGARRDMDEAVAIWKRESAAGSSYADNFLGAYYKGTFNRPQLEFIHPDNETADSYWLRAAKAGNIVGERNYAAQLLSGLGVAPDPDRALAMLNDALEKGDERAAGVLGVALYTGVPAGVRQDRERGWVYIKRAQCVDKLARELLEREINRGARPQADRHACS